MDLDSSAPTLDPMDEDMLEEGDMVMFLPVDMGTVSFHLMRDMMIACRAEHKDNPFFIIVIGLSFYHMACLGSRIF